MSVSRTAKCAAVEGSNSSAPERPDLPSPRTLWSVRGQRAVLRRWCRFHQKLADEAATYRPAAESGTRLVLFGDSITESWRGTEFGRRVPRAVGVPKALRQTLGATWPSPLALGIAGDQTQHLLWRLDHGELSPAMAIDPHMMCVLLIGTNNLGNHQRPAAAATGVRAVVAFLLQRTRARVLVLASLPRADTWRLRAFCPRSCRDANETTRGGVRMRCVCDTARQPPRSFVPAITRLNQLTRTAVASLREPRVAFVDCGGAFIEERLGPDGAPAHPAVRRSLMPDALHPNATGQALLGGCIAAAVARMLRTAPA